MDHSSESMQEDALMLQSAWTQLERQLTGRGCGAYKGLGRRLQQSHQGSGRAQLHQVTEAAHDLEGGAAIQAGGDFVLQIRCRV